LKLEGALVERAGQDHPAIERLELGVGERRERATHGAGWIEYLERLQRPGKPWHTGRREVHHRRYAPRRAPGATGGRPDISSVTDADAECVPEPGRVRAAARGRG